MRTASTAAKPCQEDSSEFYLITGSIYTDQRGTVVIATIFDEVTKTLSSISVDYHKPKPAVFCYSDTVSLSRSDEVLKLKNFKKDATLKLFKSTNQERYEHVGLEVTSSQDGKTKIHVDNESVICVVKNPVYHSKTKHIEIRHHFIRDPCEKRLIEMVKIHTDNNVADLLTKAFDEMDTGGSPRHQDTIGGAPTQTRSERVLEKPNEPPLSEGHTSGSGEGRMEHQFELTANVPITPYDLPLLRGYTPGSDEGRLKLQELMTMCTKLSKQVLDLEKEKEEI
ncbi:hypothetical protein Tco_0157167 [Tanacetum coccineum]